MWRTYREAGAQCLVVSGPAEGEAMVRAYSEAVPAAAFALCRLHAGRRHLAERIICRGRGGSWTQPGGPLRGQPVARLLHVADQAAAVAAGTEDAGTGDRCVDTDGLTVGQVADAIVAGAEVRLLSMSLSGQ